MRRSPVVRHTRRDRPRRRRPPAQGRCCAAPTQACVAPTPFGSPPAEAKRSSVPFALRASAHRCPSLFAQALIGGLPPLLNIHRTDPTPSRRRPCDEPRLANHIV